MYKTGGLTGGFPLTFVFYILLFVLSDNQPSVWRHLEAVLNPGTLFQRRVGGWETTKSMLTNTKTQYLLSFFLDKHMQAHSNHLLPSTLWETLGSRKLSGSSSSPSLSQARPFCGLPAFFWALPAFPSSSDKSLSDSARMSSILERRRRQVFKEQVGYMYKGWQGFVFGNSSLPCALHFRCLLFALWVVLLLCGLFPPLGASLSLADVCEHLVVFCRQHALHQLKTGNPADC